MSDRPYWGERDGGLGANPCGQGVPERNQVRRGRFGEGQPGSQPVQAELYVNPVISLCHL